MLLLDVKNLHVEVNNKLIIKGLNLSIQPGEVHVIMGPNGSGKSTFGSVIAGKPEYKVTKGLINFKGKNITDLSIEERAVAGIFLSYQNPIEIPGVSNINFIKSAVNHLRKARNGEQLSTLKFMSLLKSKIEILGLDKKFISRGVNSGYSGGEKKCNEVLQMMMTDPDFCILDEIDSGLDVDALRIVANALNHFRNKNVSYLIITHYQRLLDYIKPDFIHIFSDGKIVRSGGAELSLQVEKEGYSNLFK